MFGSLSCFIAPHVRYMVIKVYIKGKLFPYQAVESHRCVSCELRTSSTYNNINLFLYKAVEAHWAIGC
jgi:hypothetical protein